MRIAVDAMGGDHAPGRPVDGALAAARHLGIGIDLVGRAADVREALDRHPDAGSLEVAVVDAPDVVGMDEAAAQAIRRKPHSSIMIAARRVREGHAAAMVSAGHTGATVMAAHATFGLMVGVERPALAAIVPTSRGSAVLLDAGATVECRAAHLVQFGVMGSAYAQAALGIDRPRVGLLSIGEEETKGTELIREAHRLLKAAPLAFVGNVEARAIFAGEADVIVCDGFTGNVALKLCEGVVEMVEHQLQAELQSTFSSQMGYLLSQRAYRRFRKRVDYSEYGGAPLVGTAAIVVVAHGRSSVKAIRNAVAQAARFAGEGGLRRLESAMTSLARTGTA